MNGNVSIVIGSWGSYNECNERALGSKWLDLSDYNHILFYIVSFEILIYTFALF